MEKVAFDNRGTRYEISEQTFNELRNSICEAGDVVRKSIKDGNIQKVYLNRNNSCTSNIFDFLNGDKLHIPSDACPNKFKKELLFWGISEDDIDTCCLTKYVSFFEELRTLEILQNGENERALRREQVDIIIENGGWRSVRARLWRIIEYPNSSISAKIYFYVSNAVVLLSLFSLVASTHPLFQRPLTSGEWKEFFTDEEESYYDHHWGYDYEYDGTNNTVNLSDETTNRSLPSNVQIIVSYLTYVNMITAAYFTIELICKCLSFPFPWKHFFTFLNVIDIFALTVMYLSIIRNEVDKKEKYQNTLTDAIHSLQIFRVFRLFRIVRHIPGFHVIVYTLRASLLELMIILLGLMVAVLLFSSMAYFSRDPAFPNIPMASWWAIVTLTTVGYGDHSPVTVQGKLVGSICAVSGVCLLALLIPVLVNNFLLFYSHYAGLKRKIQRKEEPTLRRCSSVLPQKS